MDKAEPIEDTRPRCWACGKLLTDKDIMGDLCNHCSGLAPKPIKR